MLFSSLLFRGRVCLGLSRSYLVMNFNKSLGRVFIDLRKRKTKLSQEALAHKIGLHRAHLGRLEQGSGTLRVDTLRTIAKALGVRAGDILNKAERLHPK